MSVHIKKEKEAQSKRELLDFLMNLSEEEIRIIYQHCEELTALLQA